MTTLAAQIGPDGIVAPDYADVLQQERVAYWSIYGNDADLDDDSLDGEFLAIFAQAIYDVDQMAVALYNAYSPATAQGVSLSNAVKINGLARGVPTNSQAVVAVVGDVGTPIINGLVGDDLNLGTQWALPALVTIPVGGTINETVTCTAPGSTTAGAGTLNKILTPTRGWASVTNAAPAVPGNPVETDAALRQRQSVSTQLPAQSIVGGIYGAVANLPGVKRLAVYENDTNAPDVNGVPAHSISVVVEGGDAVGIATAIALKKSPGTGTYGTTTEVVIDSHGVSNTINFYPVTEVSINVSVTIKALGGYVSTTGDALVAAVAAFINGLAIGEESYLARLYSPANLGGAGLGATFYITLLKQARAPAAPAVQDLAMLFNEAPTCAVANVTLVVT